MIDKIFQFVRFTEKFRNIERVVFSSKLKQENDAEHSFQLALLSWYLAETNKLPLDKNKIIKYALIHDLVETYAGDTYIFADKKELDSKTEREAKAREKIIKEFPEFKDFAILSDQYENKSNKEARFVYALDKLLPIVNIITLDPGKPFKEREITLKKLLDHKKGKISLSEEVQKYYEELVKILKEKEKTLF